MIPLPVIVPRESSKVRGDVDLNFPDQSKCRVMSSIQVTFTSVPDEREKHVIHTCMDLHACYQNFACMKQCFCEFLQIFTVVCGRSGLECDPSTEWNGTETSKIYCRH